jgi:hypothetical protein
MKYAIFCLLAIVTPLLTSCIDGEEEVYIKADGSAKVKAVYRVPGILFSAEDAEELKTNITEGIEKQKNLQLIANRVDKENGTRIITIEIETDDMMALEGVLADHTRGVNSSKADKMLHAIMGTITVNLDGLKAGLQRDVDLGPLLDANLGKNSASILGDSEFRYIVHLPAAAETSNAHTVEDNGRTLKWAFKLRECRDKPISLNMVASIPLPWWVYAMVVLGLLVLAWAIFAFAKKWRARRLQTAATA